MQITQWDFQNKGKSGQTGASSFFLLSATALHVFASQHNFFRTTWPDCAKSLLSTFHYYLQITGWTLVYNVPEAFLVNTVTLFIVLLVSLLNVGVSFSLC